MNLDDRTEATAQIQFEALRVDRWPTYGSYDWLRLHPKDPRRYAATLEAAELFRKGDGRKLKDARELCYEMITEVVGKDAARSNSRNLLMDEGAARAARAILDILGH